MDLKTPFNVNYPLEILDHSRKINFSNPKERKALFKRNIYYHTYGREKNRVLKEKSEKYTSLSEGILDYIGNNYPSLEVLSLSLFGSSLFSENPGDFDFLAIVKGNVFLLDESEISLRNEIVPVGVSIKGLDNFTKGFFTSGLEDPEGRLEPIIDRTAISLFRRHLPVFGNDFVDNSEVFQDNIYAQVSDLLFNAYDLFYKKNKRLNLNDQQRSKKILSRTYEALSYLEFSSEREQIGDIRKKVYFATTEGTPLSKSKNIFNEVMSIYRENVLREKRFEKKGRRLKWK